MTQPDPLASFAEADLATYVLEGLQIDRTMALKWLVDEIRNEFSLNDPGTQERRRAHFGIPGATAEDYAEHIVDLDEGRRICCGIRHENSDPRRPFVHLRPNFRFENREQALAVYEHLAPRFRVFDPGWIRIYGGDSSWGDRFGASFLVCRTSDVLGRKPWPREAELTLVRETDESYYPWYEAGYAEFHAEHPELRGNVTINSKKTMKPSLEQGCLYTCELNGTRMGLIAATRTEFLGCSGIYFTEILISRTWKRQGWAKVLQSGFLRKICRGDELIWGTIEAQNLPSLRTAESNGRRTIRQEIFIQIQPLSTTTPDIDGG